jgi:predicted RNA binding protein YcfA (HicA-like mRNA interferase family)
LTRRRPAHIIGAMDSRTIIRKLEAAGWKHFRTTGSHRHFCHSDNDQVVTVPHPKKDVPIGTIKSIERQSGMRLRRR